LGGRNHYNRENQSFSQEERSNFAPMRDGLSKPLHPWVVRRQGKGVAFLPFLPVCWVKERLVAGMKKLLTEDMIQSFSINNTVLV
jgi:hypothetical protein